MFKFEEDKYYCLPPNIPPFFGGSNFDADFTATANMLSLDFTIKTDSKYLINYLPEGFELIKPELTITLSQLRDCNWMLGAGYNLIQASVPAHFNGMNDKLDAIFPLVIWENNTIPITGGREQSGQPKIFADIENLHFYKGKYFTNASIFGETFLRLEMISPIPFPTQKLEEFKSGPTSSNVFGWRYIPKVNAPGAALSEPILYPQSVAIKAGWYGKGTINWIVNEKNIYNKIISQLSDLPIYDNISVTSIKGIIYMNALKGRVLK